MTDPITAALMLAIMFTTEKQYTEADVNSIINYSRLPAAQNIIGIDPNWDEAAATRKAIAKAGAKLHVYHQGPGMEEFGESSKNWEANLRKMLLKHSEAVSYEVDNTDQLDKGYLDWIVNQQKWQREHGFKGRLVLKNTDPKIVRAIKTSDRVDQSLISPFIIIETAKGGLPKDQVAAIAGAARSFGMTPVLTYDTNAYMTKAPVIGPDNQ